MHFDQRYQTIGRNQNGETMQMSEIQRNHGIILVHESHKVSAQVQEDFQQAEGMLTFFAKGLEIIGRCKELQMQVYEKDTK